NLKLTFTNRGVQVRSSEGTSTSAAYGSPIHLPGLRFTVAENPGVDAAELVVLTRNQAIGMFADNFYVVQRDRTMILDLGYTADDPDVSQRVTNAAAAIFQENSIEKSDADTQHRLDFLREQMAYTDSLVVDAQAKLSSFQKQQQAYSATAKFQERQARIDTRDTDRAEAEADLRMYKMLNAQLQASRGANVGRSIQTLVSSPEVAGNPVIGPLFNQLVEYQTTRDTMTAGVWGKAETNPDVQRVDKLISETQNRLVSAVSSQLAAMEAKVGSLRELQNEAVSSIQGLPQADAEEVRLVQQVEGLGKMSLFLREEFHKMRLSEVVESGKLEVVDAALPGWSVNTPEWQVFLSCILLGLVFGGGGAVLLDRSNTSIRRRDDIERILQVPPLAVIPRVAEGGVRRIPLRVPVVGRNGNGRAVAMRDLVATHQADSTGAEAYRTLRTNLIFSQALQALKTIVVTSPSMGEGRTTVASNLAITFAQQGMRVLLVDCDLRRPRLHSLFGVPREPGLTHFVLGQGAIGEVVRSTGVEGLSVLPAGILPPMNPSDLLGGALMRSALDQLSAHFDLLILDTPPLLASTAGTAVLGAQADGVLLVLKAGQTDREEAQQALQQLAAVGARVVGAVLNDPDAKVPDYAAYETVEA
ncbi:MAG TPA: polysaccharide biosynthesis tyrosine autokinase, partial [Longimicrobiaceae bacterium]